MKEATIALVVRLPDPEKQEAEPRLVETLSDDRDIAILEMAIAAGRGDPMSALQEHRRRASQQEEEFGDYVEKLLTQPFLKPEIREHGVQWMRSKVRIEEYQRAEEEAVKIIAEYALRVYTQDREKTDFMLAGPSAHVRVRVFALNSNHSSTRVA